MQSDSQTRIIWEKEGSIDWSELVLLLCKEVCVDLFGTCSTGSCRRNNVTKKFKILSLASSSVFTQILSGMPMTWLNLCNSVPVNWLSSPRHWGWQIFGQSDWEQLTLPFLAVDLPRTAYHSPGRPSGRAIRTCWLDVLHVLDIKVVNKLVNK